MNPEELGAALTNLRKQTKVGLRELARTTDLGHVLFLYADDNGGHVPESWLGTGGGKDRVLRFSGCVCTAACLCDF